MFISWIVVVVTIQWHHHPLHHLALHDSLSVVVGAEATLLPFHEVTRGLQGAARLL